MKVPFLFSQNFIQSFDHKVKSSWWILSIYGGFHLKDATMCSSSFGDFCWQKNLIRQKKSEMQFIAKLVSLFFQLLGPDNFDEA